MDDEKFILIYETEDFKESLKKEAKKITKKWEKEGIPKIFPRGTGKTITQTKLLSEIMRVKSNEQRK